MKIELKGVGFIGSICCSSTMLLAPAYAKGPEAGSPVCQMLSVRDASTLPTIRAIRQPGAYCLNSSLHQPRIFSGSSGQEIRGKLSFIYVVSAEVGIDFRGYGIQSRWVGRTGILVDRYYPPGKRINSLNYPLFDFQAVNGAISTTGDKPAITLPKQIPHHLTPSDYLSSERQSISRIPEEEINQNLERLNDRRNFPDAHVNHSNAVESMTLRASPVTVQIAGRSTRIIGNRIEVEAGKAGLLLWGEAPVIENNIIIFRGAGRNRSAAPIKLFQADNAVIRNNLIIIEDVAQAPAQAVSLIQSRNVTIQANRIFGGKQVAHRFDGQSDAVESGNALLPYSDRPVIGGQARAASQVSRSAPRAGSLMPAPDSFNF